MRRYILVWTANHANTSPVAKLEGGIYVAKKNAAKKNVTKEKVTKKKAAKKNSTLSAWEGMLTVTVVGGVK